MQIASPTPVSQASHPPSESLLKRLERREKLVYLAFLAPALLFLALMFVVPLGMFLSQSFLDPNFTLENYQKAFTRPIYMKILWRTLLVSGETTLICLLVGYPVAFVMAHGSNRIKLIVTALVLIPFWTNILVRMFAWMALLGRNGVINRNLMEFGLIDAPIPMLFNHFSLTIGMVHFMLPYMILPLFSVMTNIPQNLMDAAANLGADTRRTFTRVYLPLSLPGIGAGVLLVFILSLGFFVTPALLGGPNDTMLAQIIELEINDSLDWGFGAALSTILLVLTVTLYALYDRFISADRIYEGR